MEKNKVYFLLTIIILLLISCEPNNNQYSIISDGVLKLGNDIEKTEEVLIQIQQKKIPTKVLPSYDSLILVMDDYYKYLDLLDYEAIESKENIFYNGMELNEKGKIFKEKTEKFIKNCSKHIQDKDLLTYFHSLFSISDIQYDDKLFINYFEYNFKDFPYEIYCYYLKKRKFDITLFKNEAINSFIENN